MSPARNLQKLRDHADWRLRFAPCAGLTFVCSGWARVEARNWHQSRALVHGPRLFDEVKRNPNPLLNLHLTSHRMRFNSAKEAFLAKTDMQRVYYTDNTYMTAGFNRVHRFIELSLDHEEPLSLTECRNVQCPSGLFVHLFLEAESENHFSSCDLTKLTHTCTW